MNIKIIQPAGLGDILFCQKIAKIFIKKGYNIYWPVIPQYSWISEYIKHDNLIWENIENPDICINLQNAGLVYPHMPFMDAKYELVKMSYENWQDYVSFIRKPEKEESLYKLRVTEEPYCLICDVFCSPPNVRKRFIPYGDLPIVKIDFIEEYTPFDWCKVIENASELRIVDTCFTHIIEKLNIKAKKMVLYSRDGNFYTQQLWKKPWEYVR